MSFIYYLKCLLHLTPKYDQSLIIRDVAYFSGSDAHVDNKLDIFLPFPKVDSSVATSDEQQDTSKKRIPIIVHIPGGGWIRGSPTVGRTCAREGFIGVVVSYRLARRSLLSFLA
ncbi:unnamed protein product [Rotaria socialis]|uniref:Uncharacterized protein n=2 Tax=Rotaria socialis TaxID=392032 RepID=A0A817S3X8_9BILA|nr:unnamed protein product [Rotaria socialis]CAF3283463.1 unnamed protein product [Rotaria socialis]CAF4385331.1 unnamed protein product [Rotaria socialis]CAF4490813.1 unnamed protein product [Rotaria socialis]